MTKTISVASALSDSGLINDSKITIQGLFVLKSDQGYLVEARGDLEDPAKVILIEFPNMNEYLSTRVPALGGSEYAYCNDAKISGQLHTSSDGRYHTLIKLDHMEIIVDGETFVPIGH